MSAPTTANVAGFVLARRAFNGIRDVAFERDLNFVEALRYVIDTGLRTLSGRTVCPRCELRR